MNIRPCLALALVLFGWASPTNAQSLTTLFAQNNGGSPGGIVFFDVQVLNPAGIWIRSFDLNCRNQASPEFSIEIYLTHTTYVGNENNQAVWWKVATGTGHTLPMDAPARADTTGFFLPQGSYGMGIVSSVGQAYTNGTGPGPGGNQNFQNADLALTLGAAANTPFSGTAFTPRVWNGTIHYERARSIASLFAANNNGSVGGMVLLDLEVLNQAGIWINALEMNIQNQSAPEFEVELFLAPDTYVGKENDRAAWRPISAGVGRAMPWDTPSPVRLDGFHLPRGRYGLGIVTSSSHAYTNGTGSGPGGNQSYANADLSLSLGAALNSPFTGTPFTPRVWNGRLVYQARPNMSLVLDSYGRAGCGSGYVPTLHAAGAVPFAGNGQFTLISENLIGGTPGVMLFSSGRSSFSILGMNMLLDPTVLLAVPVVASSGPTGPGRPGDGTMYLPLPIPRTAPLGAQVFTQGMFYDPSKPFSWVESAGLAMTMVRSFPSELSVIHDRIWYQSYFAGATAAQADQRGRAIWEANRVAGYNYVRTEQFLSGGESHWMVILSHGRTGLEFCLIPGGSFRMGDISGIGLQDERPVRWVRVKPFLLARTEVPQSLWVEVMASNPSLFPGPDLPVDSVSWNAATRFSASVGLRLPTEAEWEYACRAGVERDFSFGEDLPAPSLGLYAWYRDNRPNHSTQPVGTRRPNAFGLYDMHGNVREFVEDVWNFDYRCAPTDGSAWVPQQGARITRGGSFDGGAGLCRSAYRFDFIGATTSYWNLGFRPAGPTLP